VSAIFALWCASVAFGAFAAAYLKRKRGTLHKAIRLTGVALVPGLLPLGERGLQALVRSVAPLSTRGPFLLLTLLAGLCIIGSYWEYPTSELDDFVGWLRRAHVLGWACALVMGVSMVLDV
jgi:hypothetical protein